MKNTTNPPNRKPKNLLDYYIGLDAPSFNDDFFHRIREEGKSIIKILEDENPPNELTDAIFIIELNKFNDDLLEIISAINISHAANKNLNTKLEQAEEFLKKIDPKELIFKIRSFYRIAWDYDKNFNFRAWYPGLNSRHLIFRNTHFLNIKLHYSENKPNCDNIYDAHLFIEEHDEFFKNFINVLYGDNEEGEKFIGNKFNKIINNYKYLIKTNNEIKKHLATDMAAEIEIQNKCKQKVEVIMMKYPATIYKAIIDLLDFSEKSNNLNISVSTSVA